MLTTGDCLPSVGISLRYPQYTAITWAAMLAVMDEAVAEGAGGDFYVLGAAVVLADEDAARELFRAVLHHRATPFHWYREGVQARDRMVAALGEAGAVAHVCVHHPTRRTQHEQARAAGMAQLIPQLLLEGVHHLLIEGRDAAQDVRDRGVILDVLREKSLSSPFTYDWGGKTEPLLWAADAICGATREMVVGEPAYHKAMDAAGVIGAIHFVGPAPPELRKSRPLS